MKPNKNNVIELSDRRTETREQALERLYREHYSALKKFLSVRLGVFQERDDIVQEVFTRLSRLDNLPERLPVGGSRNRSYIFRAANNYVRDLFRHQSVRNRYLQQRQVELGEDAEVSNMTLERQVQADQQLHRLKQMVMTLKPKCREVFVRNRFLDKSYREVAVDMGLSVKQVEKYMQQALVKVRKLSAELKGMEE
ncbi:RNA polymerase sigma factor [Porticoccus sp. GXU_MW_L64]